MSLEEKEEKAKKMEINTRHILIKGFQDMNSYKYMKIMC